MKINRLLILFIIIAFNSFSQEYTNTWKDEINAFESLNSNNLEQEGILFTGSSSIKFWKNPAIDYV